MQLKILSSSVLIFNRLLYISRSWHFLWRDAVSKSSLTSRHSLIINDMLVVKRHACKSLKIIIIIVSRLSVKFGTENTHTYTHTNCAYIYIYIIYMHSLYYTDHRCPINHNLIMRIYVRKKSDVCVFWVAVQYINNYKWQIVHGPFRQSWLHGRQIKAVVAAELYTYFTSRRKGPRGSPK